jgi:hypothetical protein
MAELSAVVRELLTTARETLLQQLERNFRQYCEGYLVALSKQMDATDAAAVAQRQTALAATSRRLPPGTLAELVAASAPAQPSLEAVLDKLLDQSREQLDVAAARMHRSVTVELKQSVVEALRSHDPDLLWLRLPEPLVAAVGGTVAPPAPAGQLHQTQLQSLVGALMPPVPVVGGGGAAAAVAATPSPLAGLLPADFVCRRASCPTVASSTRLLCKRRRCFSSISNSSRRRRPRRLRLPCRHHFRWPLGRHKGAALPRPARPCLGTRGGRSMDRPMPPRPRLCRLLQRRCHRSSNRSSSQRRVRAHRRSRVRVGGRSRQQQRGRSPRQLRRRLRQGRWLTAKAAAAAAAEEEVAAA